MTCGCGNNSGCGCNSCQSNCQCNTPAKSSVSPYYNQAGCVQETHCQSVIQTVFVTALASKSDFIVPNCNGFGIINFEGLANIQIGSYLWNATFGYFLVTAFDYMSGDVTIKNECLLGNAAPGTSIPRCTLFNIVDPPCNCPEVQRPS